MFAHEHCCAACWWDHCPASALCCLRKWCPKHPINKHIKTFLFYYRLFHQIVPLSSDVSCITPHKEGQMVHFEVLVCLLKLQRASTDKLTLFQSVNTFHTFYQVWTSGTFSPWFLFSLTLFKCHTVKMRKVFGVGYILVIRHSGATMVSSFFGGFASI